MGYLFAEGITEQDAATVYRCWLSVVVVVFCLVLFYFSCVEQSNGALKKDVVQKNLDYPYP